MFLKAVPSICTWTALHWVTERGALWWVSWNQATVLNDLGFHPGFDFKSNNFTFISHILCSIRFDSVLKSSRSDVALDKITWQDSCMSVYISCRVFFNHMHTSMIATSFKLRSCMLYEDAQIWHLISPSFVYLPIHSVPDLYFHP